MRFVTEVKSGKEVVRAPLYSHVSYDIVPNEYQMVHQPDILILEGLNVLQTGPTLMISDLFDFSVYVDARVETLEKLFINLFLRFRHTAFHQSGAHFAAS